MSIWEPLQTNVEGGSEAAWNCMDEPLAQELLALASWMVKWEGVRLGNWSGVEDMAGRKWLGP